jgi:hypothetical protein
MMVWQADQTVKFSKFLRSALNSVGRESEFGTRFKIVLGVQYVNHGVCSLLLERISMYGTPKEIVHAIAVAPYFNNSRATTTTPSVDQVFAAYRSCLNDPAEYDSHLAHYRDLCKSLDLIPTCYELGQDIAGHGSPAAIESTYDPRMNQFYQDYLDKIWSFGFGRLNQYCGGAAPIIGDNAWPVHWDRRQMLASPKHQGIVTAKANAIAKYGR